MWLVNPEARELERPSDEDRERSSLDAARGSVDQDEELGAFLTVDEVAEMLRINKSTVYRMAKEGRIPATRVGRQWRFRLKALDGFFDAGGELANEA